MVAMVTILVLVGASALAYYFFVPAVEQQQQTKHGGKQCAEWGAAQNPSNPSCRDVQLLPLLLLPLIYNMS